MLNIYERFGVKGENMLVLYIYIYIYMTIVVLTFSRVIETINCC